MTTAPKRFEGTQEEKDRNRRSHYFIDGRCADCDCRPWGRIAEWPCGVEPPRVTDQTAGLEFDARFHAYAAAGGVA